MGDPTKGIGMVHDSPYRTFPSHPWCKGSATSASHVQCLPLHQRRQQGLAIRAGSHACRHLYHHMHVKYHTTLYRYHYMKRFFDGTSIPGLGHPAWLRRMGKVLPPYAVAACGAILLPKPGASYASESTARRVYHVMENTNEKMDFSNTGNANVNAKSNVNTNIHSNEKGDLHHLIEPTIAIHSVKEPMVPVLDRLFDVARSFFIIPDDGKHKKVDKPRVETKHVTSHAKDAKKCIAQLFALPSVPAAMDKGAFTFEAMFKDLRHRRQLRNHRIQNVPFHDAPTKTSHHPMQQQKERARYLNQLEWLREEYQFGTKGDMVLRDKNRARYLDIWLKARAQPYTEPGSPNRSEGSMVDYASTRWLLHIWCDALKDQNQVHATKNTITSFVPTLPAHLPPEPYRAALFQPSAPSATAMDTSGLYPMSHARSILVLLLDMKAEGRAPRRDDLDLAFQACIQARDVGTAERIFMLCLASYFTYTAPAHPDLTSSLPRPLRGLVSGDVAPPRNALAPSQNPHHAVHLLKSGIAGRVSPTWWSQLIELYLFTTAPLLPAALGQPPPQPPVRPLARAERLWRYGVLHLGHSPNVYTMNALLKRYVQVGAYDTVDVLRRSWHAGETCVAIPPFSPAEGGVTSENASSSSSTLGAEDATTTYASLVPTTSLAAEMAFPVFLRGLGEDSKLLRRYPIISPLPCAKEHPMDHVSHMLVVMRCAREVHTSNEPATDAYASYLWALRQDLQCHLHAMYEDGICPNRACMTQAQAFYAGLDRVLAACSKGRSEVSQQWQRRRVQAEGEVMAIFEAWLGLSHNIPTGVQNKRSAHLSHQRAIHVMPTVKSFQAYGDVLCRWLISPDPASRSMAAEKLARLAWHLFHPDGRLIPLACHNAVRDWTMPLCGGDRVMEALGEYSTFIAGVVWANAQGPLAPPPNMNEHVENDTDPMATLRSLYQVPDEEALRTSSLSTLCTLYLENEVMRRLPAQQDAHGRHLFVRGIVEMTCQRFVKVFSKLPSASIPTLCHALLVAARAVLSRHAQPPLSSSYTMVDVPTRTTCASSGMMMSLVVRCTDAMDARDGTDRAHVLLYLLYHYMHPSSVLFDAPFGHQRGIEDSLALLCKVRQAVSSLASSTEATTEATRDTKGTFLQLVQQTFPISQERETADGTNDGSLDAVFRNPVKWFCQRLVACLYSDGRWPVTSLEPLSVFIESFLMHDGHMRRTDNVISGKELGWMLEEWKALNVSLGIGAQDLEPDVLAVYESVVTKIWACQEAQVTDEETTSLDKEVECRSVPLEAKINAGSRQEATVAIMEMACATQTPIDMVDELVSELMSEDEYVAESMPNAPVSPDVTEPIGVRQEISAAVMEMGCPAHAPIDMVKELVSELTPEDASESEMPPTNNKDVVKPNGVRQEPPVAVKGSAFVSQAPINMAEELGLELASEDAIESEMVPNAPVPANDMDVTELTGLRHEATASAMDMECVSQTPIDDMVDVPVSDLTLEDASELEKMTNAPVPPMDMGVTEPTSVLCT